METLKTLHQNYRESKLLFLLPLVLSLIPILVNFLGEKYVPMAIAIVLLLFFLEKKHPYQKNKEGLFPFATMILVYIFFTATSLDILVGLKVLERQVSLLLLPLVIFYSDFTKKRFELFFKCFITSIAVISFWSFMYLLWFYHSNIEWINIMDSSNTPGIYLQFKFPHLIGAHPTYWSYLLVISNIILLSSKSLGVFRNKIITGLLFVIFNGTIFYLSARTPMMINLIVHFFALYVYIKENKISRIKILGIIIVFFLVAFTLFNSPLAMAKLFGSVNDERFFLWPVALDQIKDNYFLLGEGLGHGQRILKDYIIQNGDSRKVYDGFDLHNQYLKNYLDMGLLGFLALLYLLFSPLKKIKGGFIFKNFPLIGFTILFALALFTEGSLYRLRGIIIFAIFSSIFSSFHKLSKEKY